MRKSRGTVVGDLEAAYASMIQIRCSTVNFIFKFAVSILYGQNVTIQGQDGDIWLIYIKSPVSTIL